MNMVVPKLTFHFKREFNFSNQPLTCLWCGKKLLSNKAHPGTYGAYADNAFCSMRCGYLFGAKLAELGKRLTKI